MAATKTRNLMTEEELIELEKQEFETGPLSVLLNAVKNNTQVDDFLDHVTILLCPCQFVMQFPPAALERTHSSRYSITNLPDAPKSTTLIHLGLSFEILELRHS